MASGATDEDQPPKPAPTAQAEQPSTPTPTPQPFPPYPPPPYQPFPFPPHTPPPAPPFAAYPPGNPNPHSTYSFPPPPYCPHQYPPTTQPIPQRRCNFTRFIITLLIMLIVGAFAMNFLSLFLFGIGDLDFYVKSLVVPYFNATNNEFQATWDANIIVKNNGSKAGIRFDRLVGSVEYGEGVILGIAEVEISELEPHEETIFSVNISSRSKDEMAFSHVYSNMTEDRNKKEIIFGLMLKAEITMKIPAYFNMQTSKVFLCNDLKVRFEDPSGLGILADDKPIHERRFNILGV